MHHGFKVAMFWSLLPCDFVLNHAGQGLFNPKWLLIRWARLPLERCFEPILLGSVLGKNGSKLTLLDDINLCTLVFPRYFSVGIKQYSRHLVRFLTICMHSLAAKSCSNNTLPMFQTDLKWCQQVRAKSYSKTLIAFPLITHVVQCKINTNYSQNFLQFQKIWLKLDTLLSYNNLIQ